jgi:diguanylate cyclase (GGDEF)-like protein/PAS domain S-box-containing protein
MNSDVFQVLFKDAAVSFMIHNGETGEIILANSHAYDSYGIPEDSDINSKLIWAEPPYSFKDAKNWIKRAYESGTQRFDWKSLRTTGEEFWEEVILQKLIFQGSPVIVSTSIDISERKKAENAFIQAGEKLLKVNNELRENEERFRALSQHTSAGIYIMHNKRFILVNPAMVTILGYPEDELLSHDLTVFVHPDYRKVVSDRAMAHQRGENVPEQYEIKILSRHGETRWVEITAGATSYNEKPSIIGTVFDITDRKQAEENIRQMALQDILTGLPNRILLEDRADLAISSANRRKTRFALLFIDLDDFKPVNDMHGHRVGDLLLKEAAVRIRNLLRGSDTPARIGGDEFLVLLPDIESENDAVIAAEKICGAFSDPFIIEGKNLKVSSSIGIAIYPDHGDDLIKLSRNADIAMYKAKKTGPGNVSVYKPAAETENHA